MSQSLYTSMGGIAAATTQLSVISNNVANINTTAFKASSVEFSDVYSTTLSYGSVATTNSGGTNPKQIGVGTQVSAISTDFNTGSWMATGNDTDLMINGGGFFAVQSPDKTSTFYTRAGDFSVDAKGNLVTSEGYKVLGTNKILSSVTSGTTVQVPISITAEVAGNVNIGTQLVTNLNNVDGTITSGYFQVTKGAGAPINVTFNDTDVTGTVNALVAKFNSELGVTFDGTGAITAAPNGVVASCSNGEIKFTSVSATTPFAADGGTLHFDTPTTSTVKGGNTYQPSNFLTKTEVISPSVSGVSSSKDLDLTVSISNLTKASESTTSNSTTINQDGTLEVTYKDGSTLSVELGTGANKDSYQFVYTTTKGRAIKNENCVVSTDVAKPENLVIQMATVTNTEGLLASGNNLYTAGPNTGDIVYTTANQMGCGGIQSGGLEASNVDLSKELSNMILAQRSIQANSRVFTTTSDIMQTITQMGR